MPPFLVILRHPQTLSQAGRPGTRPTCDALSPQGVNDALKAGDGLRTAGVARILHAPDAASLQTALLLASQLGGPAIEACARLGELGIDTGNVVSLHAGRAYDVHTLWAQAEQVLTEEIAPRLTLGPMIVVAGFQVSKALMARIEHTTAAGIEAAFPAAGAALRFEAARVKAITG